MEHDNKGVITELLNNGADPNIKEERTGKTPSNAGYRNA